MDKCYREEIVGVFGDPVDENPTVVVAHAAFEQLGIPYRYVNFNVKPENLEDAFKGLLAMQFKGIHLTIPHKVAAIPMLDSISEEAAIMGAVNTVVNKDGKLHGENTDGKGFMKSMFNAGIDVAGKKITMLGAGGAARAIAVELARAGIGELVIINRTESRGLGLLKTIEDNFDIKASYVKWDHTMDIDADTDILVNTTDIGLFPNVDAKPDINFDCITPAMIVADIIPNHPITQLIKEADKRGARTLDGLGMLINQCVESIYDWTGETPDAENMKKALAKEYGLEVHI